MREVKMKFWNTDLREMTREYTLEEWTIKKLKEGANNPEFEFGKGEIENLTPLFSTTLRDKNGKEIWEGDMLSWDDNKVHIIEWRDSGWAFRGERWQLSMITDEERGAFEVIGNIYEGLTKIRTHPHKHVFTQIGGGCVVANNHNHPCDTEYRCKCGSTFIAKSDSDTHFSLPKKIIC